MYGSPESSSIEDFKMKKLPAIILICIIAFTSVISAGAEFINDHNNTGDLKSDIIAIAKTQTGYEEADGASKYDGAVSGTFSNSSAAFLGWCANEASAPEAVIPRTADVTKLYAYY